MSVILRTALTVVLVGAAASAQAGMAQDKHGNVGYDTAAECDAAVNAGTAKFYQSFTHKPALRRAGEASVKVVPLSAVNATYVKGACDVGVGHKAGRDGVAKPLIGKYVPYSPSMPVNVYADRSGTAVRVTMKQCDNWFGDKFPRPVAVAAAAEKAVPVAAVVAPIVAAPVPTPAPLVPVKAAVAAATKVNPMVWGAVGAAALGAALIISHNNDSDDSSTPTATTTVTQTK